MAQKQVIIEATVEPEEPEVTLEELQAILKAKGLDIKELAKTARMLKEDGEINVEKPKTSSTAKATVTYALVLDKNPDFVVERKTAQTTKHLVFMPTQNAYYIKHVESGKIEALNADNYAVFTADCGGTIELNDTLWISQLTSGKKWYNDILAKVIYDRTYVEMLKRHIAPRFEHLNISKYYGLESCKELVAFKHFPRLYEEYMDNPKVIDVLANSAPFVTDLIWAFGLNNTRDFLSSLDQTLITPASHASRYITRGETEFSYCFPHFTHDSRIFQKFDGEPDDVSRSCRPRVQMEYAAFKDYVLYQSVRMGYADTLKSFWTEWDDTLKMQLQLYHKIKEKYPENLTQLHNVLSYKVRMVQEQIDAELFAAQSSLTQKYEMKIDDYVFLAPRTKEDFYDEATQQANCVAGYVSRYANGDCHIIFMRRADDTERSLVTIELKNGEVRQQYRAHNRACTEDDCRVINIWLEKVHRIDSGELDPNNIPAVKRSVEV